MKFRWETEFKETEIGEIPKDWEVKKLGDKEFELLSSGIKPFKGVKEYISTSCVNFNDIVKIEEYITYSKRPSRANMQPVENSVWFARMINSPKFLKVNKDLIENKILSTGFLGIKTHNKETCNYIFYYIQTKEFQEYKDRYVTGAVQESLTNEMAENLETPFPSLTEQSRIATVLSWFDELIENKKRQNEILEKTAMAIFKSWFIDFEPFKNEEFVYNEELGKEIPKGWEVKRLGEVAEIVKGVSFPQHESSFEPFPNSIPILRANNINDDKSIDFKDLMFIPFHKVPGFKKLREKDIIMVGSNGNPSLVGKFAVFVGNPDFPEISLGSFMYCIRTRFDYVLSNLNSDYFKEFLSSVVSGTNISNLKKTDLENYKLLLPPSHILQKFHSLVEPLFQKIILYQKQIMTLRKIRDTLLPLLVFGKLRVEEI